MGAKGLAMAKDIETKARNTDGNTAYPDSLERDIYG
jgi:hypothetical protein